MRVRTLFAPIANVVQVALGVTVAACGPPPFSAAEPTPRSALDSMAAPTNKAPAGRAPSAASRAAERRLALFDSLVAEVQHVHQFSPNTWENLAPVSFTSALPDLRDAFLLATTDAELTAALVRFGNSLHDANGGFQPAPPAPPHLTLPFLLAPSWDGESLSMVVTASKARGIDPGDVLTSYAGTPAHEFLRDYADRSNANQWRGVALDVARWMTDRLADGGDGFEGGVVTVGLRKAEGPESFANATWSRGGWHGTEDPPHGEPEYDPKRCAPGLPARKYPSYELVSHGSTYCLYTSRAADYARFPVVRFFSFDFGRAFDAEAEHEHLARELRLVPRVRGLLLDLRDNRGGDDPKWVLDWFAPFPYLDLDTRVRKTPPVETWVFEDVANLDEGWMNALASAAEGAVVSRFLGCTAATCEGTRQTPRHRILPVRVSLLVGPRCDSACDHFARVWEENGLGPIVGEPSGAALTLLRLDYPVVTSDGKKLGAMRLAVSVDYSPFTGQAVEGLPLHVDVPVAWSWAKREVYDKAMVDAAIATLAK